MKYWGSRDSRILLVCTTNTGYLIAIQQEFYSPSPNILLSYLIHKKSTIAPLWITPAPQPFPRNRVLSIGL